MAVPSKRKGLRMKKIALVIILMLTTVLTAVAKKKEYIVQYALRLADVTCDRDCGYVEGITAEPFTDINGIECVSYRYKDDVVNMTWYVSEIALNFSLVNKLDTALTMHWGQMASRGVDGRITHFGYTIERPRVLVALDVPPRMGLNGYLIPTVSYPVFSSDTIAPLIPGSYLSQKEAKKAASKYIGKEFKMSFPLTFGETVYGYRLTFVVDAALAYVYRESGKENVVTAWDAANVGEKKSILAFSTRKNRKKGRSSGKDVSIEHKKKDENPLLSAAALPTARPRLYAFTADTLLPAPYTRFLDESGQPSSDEALSRLISYAEHIDRYHGQHPQTKVYLHLDHTAYFQGETIRYAATVTDGDAPASGKELLVELLSQEDVVLQQQKLKVADGRAHGAFALKSLAAGTDSLSATAYPSGLYRLRASTHAYDENERADSFSCVIPIYEAPKREGDYARPVMRQVTVEKKEQTRKSKKDFGLNMTFYPEGGHLIKGVTSRITFNATDGHGRGVNVDVLKNDRGERLPVTALHDGMGSFMFRANDVSTQHSVHVRWKGCDYTYLLPKVEDSGCAVRIKSEANGWLLLTVSARKLGADSLLAYTITHEGRVYAFDTLRLAAPFAPKVIIHEPQLTPSAGMPTSLRQRARATSISGRQPASDSSASVVPVIYEQFRISSRSLPTGVCRFTLFGARGNVYAERLVFVDNGIPTVPVDVTSSVVAIQPFDSVTLRFQTADSIPATFSLAVRDAADYGTPFRDDIRTCRLLSSELTDPIEDPAWYFAPPTADADEATRKEALDHLMLVQRTTRHSWRQMAGIEPPDLNIAGSTVEEPSSSTDSAAASTSSGFGSVGQPLVSASDGDAEVAESDYPHRRTIYWNPEVKTDSTGYTTVSFRNNGYSRRLVISVEGLTNQGVPVLK